MKPMVLVVDDEAMQQDSLTDRLVLEGFDVICAQGVRDDLMKDALSLAATRRIDIALIDIRLFNPYDDDDDSGLRLARDLRQQHPAITIIAKTVWPPNEQITRDLFEIKVGAPSIVAFAYLDAKLMLKRGHLEEVCREALTRHDGVQVNFDLQFDPQGLEPSKLKDGFDNVSFSGAMRAAEEVEMLLRRLYFDSSGGLINVLIEPLSPGKSSAKVFVATPQYVAGWREPEIVKIDSLERIEREINNFEAYVHGQIRGRQAPSVIRHAQTERLGGFALANLGISVGDLVEFADFYRDNRYSNSQLIIDAITALFDETCGGWYRRHAVRDRRVSSWLDEEFHEWPSRFAQALEWAIGGSPSTDPITFPLEQTPALPNPLSLLQKLEFDRDYLQSVTHGDLNARNLLCDSAGRPWLLDFYRTGPSHILRDLARLETTVLFELIEATDLGALAELSERVSGLIPKQPRIHDIPEFPVAEQVIAQIRALAARAQGIGRTMDDYALIVACYALRYASYADVPAVRRRHAVLHASSVLSPIASRRRK